MGDKSIFSLPLQRAVGILLSDSHQLTHHVSGDFIGVKIDSRLIQAGDVFIAIKGKQVDGHDFINEAISQGAVAIVVSEDFDGCKGEHKVPLINVPCPQHAFGKLANLWRTELFKGKVIALTGSNGKTTIKNMLKSVLQIRYKTGSTEGNYNNELGLPITIFDLPLNCDYWILEMGARHIGDIDYLCRIALPDITFVSNIGHAHIGEFGGRKKQLQAKSEIFSYGEVSLLDRDSPHDELFSLGCQHKKLDNIITIARKGIRNNEEDINVKWDFVEGESIFYTAYGHFRLQLNCLGEHNTHNAAWVVALADYCGLNKEEIIAGLSRVQPQDGRLQMIPCKDFTIVDDSYNASPESVEALLKIKHSSDRVIMVWGDMAELGDKQAMQEYHQCVAEKFIHYRIDWVITYGDYAYQTCLHGQSISEYTQFKHTENFFEIKVLIQKIIEQWQRENFDENASIYVYLKASNKMGFAQLTELLIEQ